MTTAKELEDATDVSEDTDNEESEQEEQSTEADVEESDAEQSDDSTQEDTKEEEADASSDTNDELEALRLFRTYTKMGITDEDIQDTISVLFQRQSKHDSLEDFVTAEKQRKGSILNKLLSDIDVKEVKEEKTPNQRLDKSKTTSPPKKKLPSISTSIKKTGVKIELDTQAILKMSDEEYKRHRNALLNSIKFK